MEYFRPDVLGSAWRALRGPVVVTVLAAVGVLGACAPGAGGDGQVESPVTEHAAAATSDAQPRIDANLQIDDDGTVHVPAMAVPLSPYLSPEAKAWVNLHLHQNQDPEAQRRVDGNPVFLDQYLARTRELFPTTYKDTKIGDVHVYDYLPADDVSERNRRRVLIQLHAGAFHECWPACAELQSTPIASVGRIRVVAVDYRMAPEHKFPAASEDVAAVYRELLNSYPAENIGIFGCSAGGQLAAQVIPWFQQHDLPRPGAIGVYCGGGTQNGQGDGAYMARPLGEGTPPPKPLSAGGTPRRGGGYMSDADPNDPLAAPAVSDEVLSKFPPTQIMTGTRFFDLSSAVYTHSRLAKLGVEAELLVWEGLFHFFFYNPDLPESRDAYDLTVRFFDKHLGT